MAEFKSERERKDWYRRFEERIEQSRNLHQQRRQAEEQESQSLAKLAATPPATKYVN